MSLLRRDAQSTAQWYASQGRDRRIDGVVGAKDVLQQSVVWAGCNLRASIVSMMPVDVFGKSGGVSIQRPTPPVLVTPSTFAEGHPVSIADWLYASQMTLDLYGNNVGVIVSKNAAGLPSQIDLAQPERLSMRVKGGQIVKYEIDGSKLNPAEVWHERKNLIAGVPVGLSAITHMASTVIGARSAQKFASQWFDGGAVPNAVLRNEERVLSPEAAAAAKQSFLDSVRAGQPWASGKDWTYTPVQAKASEAAFIEMLELTSLDLVRYLNVPADMVDVKSDAVGTITYQNITQKNLQFLTVNLGPDVKRREDALSALTPKPWFVKLNRSAVLAMDDAARAEVLSERIKSRQLAPSEARAIEDREPFTEDQLAEFDRLFGNPNKQTPQKSEA